MSFEVNHGLRDAEEKKVSDRKRNILYLISNYLRDFGFRLTADCLTEEAQLTSAYEVCDNVDLDTVLQEYESYYFLKFNKLPRICKKSNECLKSAPAEGTPSRKRTSVLKKQDMRNGNESIRCALPVKTNDVSGPEKSLLVSSISKDNKLSDSISGKSLKSKVDVNGGGGENGYHDRGVYVKPLRDFVGFNSEWKELADVISREILTTDLNVQWNDIQGLDHAKSLLMESVIYPVRYPGLFRGLLSPWRGILLHGPPGSGKTLLAKAAASQSKVTFFNVSSSCLISKWRGESEKLIRVLFELARHNAPSVVFLDEVEAMSSHRDAPSEHEASRRAKSELLRQLDGLHSQCKEHVVLLATTNLPWELDAAMLRRLEKRILIDLPSADTRSQMITKLLPVSNVWPTSELKQILDRTDGYSGADIKLICKEAAMGPLREMVRKMEADTGQGKTGQKYDHVDLTSIRAKHILEAVEKVKPTANHLADKHKKWANKFGSS